MLKPTIAAYYDLIVPLTQINGLVPITHVLASLLKLTGTMIFCVHVVIEVLPFLSSHSNALRLRGPFTRFRYDRGRVRKPSNT